MEVRSHLALAELKRLERAEKDAARSKRLRIIILAIHGYTAPAVAMSVGLSRRICQRWVARYNESGLAGLDDLRGQAPSSPLTPEQEVLVRQRIEAGSLPEDQVCSLRGVDFQHILAQEFGVLRSLPGVYHLLHRLGYSYLRIHKPRKNLSARCRRSCKPCAKLIPANACEFIFKTNRASDSKARPPTCGLGEARGQPPSGRRNTNISGCSVRSVPKPDMPKGSSVRN